MLGIFFIGAALTAFGLGILSIVTFKYYWGERGTPPLTGEQRRQARAAELQLRAKQIEYSKNHPVATRKANFWDNGKVYRQGVTSDR